MIFAWFGFTSAPALTSFFCSSAVLPSDVLFGLSRYLNRFGAGFDKCLHAGEKRRIAAFQIAPVDLGKIDDLLLRAHQSESLLILAREGDKSHSCLRVEEFS